MLAPFEMHQPTSVVEASQMLSHYGPDAAVYAGGTELLVLMKERLAHFGHLVNIKMIPGLDGIRVDLASGSISIAPLATHRSIERSPAIREHAPVLAQLEGQIANVRVRAAGTIGGNLCFAEPHSDPATLLTAWGAELQLTSHGRARSVPIEDFFVGFLETARSQDELLTEISFPVPPASTSYRRFKTHERPVVSVAACLDIQEGKVRDARLVVGSVGPKPVRLRRVEAELKGSPALAAAWNAAAALAAVETEIDSEGFESVEFKSHLVEVLVKRALREASEVGNGV